MGGYGRCICAAAIRSGASVVLSKHTIPIAPVTHVHLETVTVNSYLRKNTARRLEYRKGLDERRSRQLLELAGR